MNLTRSNEHVPQIDIRIRVVKERARCVRHSLHFDRIPIILLIHIVFFSVKILNYFPTKGGLSTVYSPKTIVSGKILQYKRHLALNIVQYFQVHEEETPRNSQAASKKSRNIPWSKWKHPRWILFYESSICKKDYQKDLGCNPNSRHRNSPSKLASKSGIRNFYFCILKRPYYLRCRAHSSGHKWKSRTTTAQTTRLHRGNSTHRGNLAIIYSRY